MTAVTRVETPLALEFDGVAAGYGSTRVLHNVSLRVPQGSVVALLGPNGAGKSTLLRVAAGLVPVSRGDVRLAGESVARTPSFATARSGLCLLPEGRGIFPSLTVAENLELMGGGGDRNAEVFDLFPILQERARTPGTALSGGQQQMLAVGRALMANPQLILLDEPTEGLAPVIVDQLAATFNQLADQGTALLLIEQNMSMVVRVARRYIAMAKGAVVAEGAVENSRAGLEELEAHVMV